MSDSPPSSDRILELMAQRIEDVGLYSGTDPHHGRGAAVPPTILGAWEWVRTQTRPDWRTRGDKGLWEQFHAVCFDALHRLALRVADQPIAPEWWAVGQLAWESHVVHVWGEFHTAEEAVSAIRSAAEGEGA
jgi:hypothetical protein